MSKINVTAADLRALADRARGIGTLEAFADVALQWAGLAEKEIDRLRADAERYRWLRRAREHWDILHRQDEDNLWMDLHGNDLDAAIDAAMGKE